MTGPSSLLPPVPSLFSILGRSPFVMPVALVIMVLSGFTFRRLPSPYGLSLLGLLPRRLQSLARFFVLAPLPGANPHPRDSSDGVREYTKVTLSPRLGITLFLGLV